MSQPIWGALRNRRSVRNNKQHQGHRRAVIEAAEEKRVLLKLQTNDSRGKVLCSVY